MSEASASDRLWQDQAARLWGEEAVSVPALGQEGSTPGMTESSEFLPLVSLGTPGLALDPELGLSLTQVSGFFQNRQNLYNVANNDGTLIPWHCGTDWLVGMILDCIREHIHSIGGHMGQGEGTSEVTWPWGVW